MARPIVFCSSLMRWLVALIFVVAVRSEGIDGDAVVQAAAGEEYDLTEDGGEEESDTSESDLDDSADQDGAVEDPNQDIMAGDDDIAGNGFLKTPEERAHLHEVAECTLKCAGSMGMDAESGYLGDEKMTPKANDTLQTFILKRKSCEDDCEKAISTKKAYAKDHSLCMRECVGDERGKKLSKLPDCLVKCGDKHPQHKRDPGWHANETHVTSLKASYKKIRECKHHCMLDLIETKGVALAAWIKNRTEAVPGEWEAPWDQGHAHVPWDPIKAPKGHGKAHSYMHKDLGVTYGYACSAKCQVEVPEYLPLRNAQLKHKIRPHPLNHPRLGPDARLGQSAAAVGKRPKKPKVDL